MNPGVAVLAGLLHADAARTTEALRIVPGHSTVRRPKTEAPETLKVTDGISRYI